LPRILVIDEDPAVLRGVRQAFSRTDIQIGSGRAGNRAAAHIRQRRPDLLIIDAAFCDDRVWSTLQECAASTTFPPVIVTLACAAPSRMIALAKGPAADVLPKPFDYPRLRDLVMRLLAARTAKTVEQTGVTGGESFVAGCAAMHEVVRRVSRAASRDVTILFTGETGTGKTHFARLIQRHGPRAAGRFVDYQIAGKPADRLERELLGVERSRSTATPARHLGWLERCHGGSLLFDEVDVLPLQVQSQLISLIEEQSLRRVGAEKAIPVDVRLFAATRENLPRLIAEGRFRADLYHTLRDVSIDLPPLRERLDDLPELVRWFLVRITERPGMRPVTAITCDALELLRMHHWPGNLWELESVLRQAVRRCQASVISVDDLPEEFRPHVASASGVELPAESLEPLEAYLVEALKTDSGEIHSECVALFDRYLCRRVLKHTGGNQSRAARILGITRRSLRTKIRRLEEQPTAAATT
jgi:DNA-binding NtrC family response regulator